MAPGCAYSGMPGFGWDDCVGLIAIAGMADLDVAQSPSLVEEETKIFGWMPIVIRAGEGLFLI